MEKQIKIYDGDVIAKYVETDEKKQQLWDLLINWIQKHNAVAGETIYQNDDCIIDASEFIADAVDEIIKFEVDYENDI